MRPITKIKLFCLSHCQDRACKRNMDGEAYKRAMQAQERVSCTDLSMDCEIYRDVPDSGTNGDAAHEIKAEC